MRTRSEDDFFHETPGLGPKESSFDDTRDSHGRCCDGISCTRAAGANARGLLGRDRDFGRDAIHSRRDIDAINRADGHHGGGGIGRSAGGELFRSNLIAYAVAIFLVGLLSIAFRLEKTAYRCTSITLAIIVLIPRSAPPWSVGLHRFIEVSVGIVVALAIVALWPEYQRPSPDSTAE
jgi:hypothetical protein